MRPWSPSVVVCVRDDLGLGIGKEALDLGVQQWVVGLQCQTIVAAAVDDVPGDLDLCSHGIDGDQCPLQRQPREQQRNSL